MPDLPEAKSTQGAMYSGMRILAEAGVIPEEFALKQELEAAREA